MERPEYDGLVEPWKVALLVARAVRMGFAGEDLKDALQDIMPIVVAFKFDPAKSNGAKESTALTTIIDNQLRKLIRKRERNQKKMDRYTELVRPATEISYDLGLVNDVRYAMSGLPCREREVCLGLMSGQSKREIARTLGCGWHTVDRLVRNIRNRFLELGLDIYVSE